MIRSSDRRSLRSWELLNPFNIQHNQVGAGRSYVHDPDLIDIVKDSVSRLLFKLKNKRRSTGRVASGDGTGEREKEAERVVKPVLS